MDVKDCFGKNVKTYSSCVVYAKLYENWSLYKGSKNGKF